MSARLGPRRSERHVEPRAQVWKERVVLEDEAHATPLGVDTEGRPLTMITEATIAYSDRPGFTIAHRLSPVLIPVIKRTARQLWVDDRAYAERERRFGT